MLDWEKKFTDILLDIYVMYFMILQFAFISYHSDTIAIYILC